MSEDERRRYRETWVPMGSNDRGRPRRGRPPRPTAGSERQVVVPRLEGVRELLEITTLRLVGGLAAWRRRPVEVGATAAPAQTLKKLRMGNTSASANYWPGYVAARQGFFKPNAKVLFMHTGGLPSLHVYEDVVLGRTPVAD